MDALWTALADPNRRAMVERLAGGDLTAGELGDGLALSQPGVSKHLRVLREAELVAVRAQGTQRVYSLRPQGIEALEQWAAGIRGFWAQRLDALDTEIARGQRARKDQP